MRAESSIRNTLLRAVGGLGLLYAVLLIPLPEDPPDEITTTPRSTPFVWASDSLWYDLEEAFVEARVAGCDGVRDRVEDLLVECDIALNEFSAGTRSFDDPALAKLERDIFSVSPLIAGCPAYAEELMWRVVRMRSVLKDASAGWDMNDQAVRSAMYRLLYGGRGALEEILLQIPDGSLPSTVHCEEVPSRTPSTSMLDVTIHSGDILVSRGGAPTSALIARGNDFPGNFSHVALVHVDERTNVPTIIESHIEVGVTRSSLQEYLEDKKLRVMVLRLRPDLPLLTQDPMIPHKAASIALADAERRHIPYDFAMDFNDPEKLFCSEVASAAYDSVGVGLWMGLSTISTTGLRFWLSDFGVRKFVTQEPSDLEYDPQLRVVAEWRDLETLYKDHVDNAVTEVMLEGAERGNRLVANFWMLPVARTMKAYSWLLNLFGEVGPIPEGMSPTSALKNNYYSTRHDEIHAALLQKEAVFQNRNGYRPPYWRLVELAREALEATDL